MTDEAPAPAPSEEKTPMDLPLPERVEVRKSGHHTLDMVTSICALVVSAISIYMAWDNGNDMSKLVHANSWPALQLGSGNRPDQNAGKMMEFGAINAGVGPARVHSFTYLVDGRPIDNPYVLAGIASACCKPVLDAALGRSKGDLRAALGDSGSQTLAATFLAPQKEIVVMRWPRTDENHGIWDDLDQARQARRITTRACYCSFFDECWEVESNKFPPRSVKRCP